MDEKRIIQDKRWRRLFWKVIIIPHKIVMLGVISFTLFAFFFAFTFIMYKFENPVSGDFFEYILSIHSRIKISKTTKEEKAGRFEVRFARLSFISGQVSVRKGGGLRWATASRDLPLSTGDIIRTHSNSFAEVFFDDGNILQVKPDSLVIIGNLTEDAWTKEKHSSVKLMESDVEANIKKPEIMGSKFKIETPNAVANIKDEARLSIKVTNEQNSQIKVFSGSVDVQTTEESIEIKTAEAIEISSDKEIVMIKDLPEGPVLYLPENQQEFFFKNIKDAEIILSWEGDSKSKRFHLDVARDAHFIDLLVTKDDFLEKSVSLQEMPQGLYYWRVIGINKKGYKGSASDIRLFKVTFDNIPPRILINDILILQENKGVVIYISGETEPNTELVINKNRFKSDATGRFRGFIGRGDVAKDILRIEAYDIVGNKSYLERSIAIK